MLTIFLLCMCRGTSMTNPHGVERFVFPLLFAYVCDRPKGYKVDVF